MAQRLGLALYAGGIGMGWVASAFGRDPYAGFVATTLALWVVLYDGLLKNTPMGPLAMGTCRLLNVLLGMSLSPQPWTATNWSVASGIGTYVMGITWVARTEASDSSRFQLVFGTAVMLSGMGLLASLPAWQSIAIAQERWQIFWVLFAALIGWRCVRAIILPSSAMVQAAVRSAIHALIVLDAAVTLAVCGPFWGLAVLLLLIPTLWLGRWIYST
jgi:4-hydroxybenzoate polyprenyltransferase